MAKIEQENKDKEFILNKSIAKNAELMKSATAIIVAEIGAEKTNADNQAQEEQNLSESSALAQRQITPEHINEIVQAIQNMAQIMALPRELQMEEGQPPRSVISQERLQ